MDKDQLEAFVTVAEVRQLAAAARRLHRAPSTVSRSVARLERSLRVTLFRRGPAGLVLTEAAQSLLPMAAELLRRYDEIVDTAGALRRPTPSSLTLRCSSAVPPRVVDVVVGGLQKGSDVVLRVDPVLAASSVLAAEVSAGTTDLALVHLPVDALPGLRTRELLPYDHVVAMAVGHRLADRESVVLSDLVGETVALTWCTANPTAVEAHRDRLLAAGAEVVLVPDGNHPQLVFGVVQGRWLAIPRHPRYGGVSTLFTEDSIRTVPTPDPAVGSFRLGLAWRGELRAEQLFGDALDEVERALRLL